MNDQQTTQSAPEPAEIPEAHLLFRLALQRRQESQLDHASYYYDPALHFVYLQTRVALSRLPVALIDIAHEFSHARLGLTYYNGTSLTLFHIMTALARTMNHKYITPTIREDLGNLVDEDFALYFGFERPLYRAEEAHNKLMGVLEDHLSEFRTLIESTNFGAMSRCLVRTYNRRSEMMRASLLCQEGYATFSQLDFVKNRDFYAGVVHDTWPEEPDAFVEDVLSATEKTSDEMRGQYLSDDIHSNDPYRQGYQLYHQLSLALSNNLQDGGEISIAAWMALAYPFFACDLLDMSDADFAALVKQPWFSPDARLRTLASSPDIVTEYCEGPKGRASALKRLFSGAELSPLTGDSVLFSRWQYRKLWGSVTLQKALGGVKFDDPDDVYRDYDRLFGEDPIPLLAPSVPIVMSSGEVAGGSDEDEVMLVENYGNAWLIDLTLYLLAGLRAALER